MAEPRIPGDSNPCTDFKTPPEFWEFILLRLHDASSSEKSDRYDDCVRVSSGESSNAGLAWKKERRFSSLGTRALRKDS
jgi:hypothetical protein